MGIRVLERHEIAGLVGKAGIRMGALKRNGNISDRKRGEGIETMEY